MKSVLLHQETTSYLFNLKINNQLIKNVLVYTFDYYLFRTTHQIETLNTMKRRKKTIELHSPKVIRLRVPVDKFEEVDKNAHSSINLEQVKDLSSNGTSPAVPDTKIHQNVVSESETKKTRVKGKWKPKAHPAFEDEEILEIKNKKNKEDLSLISNSASSKRSSVKSKKDKTAKDDPNLVVLAEEVQQPQEITIQQPLSVSELAAILGRSETELIKCLFLKGIAVTINETIDIPTIELLAQELGISVNIEHAAKIKTFHKHISNVIETEQTTLRKRPPIVAILGHVDHGKTSLLDYIKKSNVAQNEAGGITQALSAYSIFVDYEEEKQKVIFLDTPGHEAFAEMRSRGALITDICILVIAADDGIKPQTIEAIQCIKQMKAALIVAITKVDKLESDSLQASITKIKEQLTLYNIVAEDWGGDTSVIQVSALTGKNIQTLLQTVILVAEFMDLKASFDGEGKGTVIEVRIDKNRGIAVVVLIQQGTIAVGDILSAGNVTGKIRIITDDSQNIVKEAQPSSIITIWGFTDLPTVGASVLKHKSEKEAKHSVKQLAPLSKRKQVNLSLSRSSEELSPRELQILNLVVKSSSLGTLEAVLQALSQIPQQKVGLHILAATPGEITETDVSFAATTKSIILGFEITLAPGAKQLATQLSIQIYEYRVIYDLIEGVKDHMKQMLAPEYSREEIGVALVKDIFSVSKGKVAGCYIEAGKLVRQSLVQVKRGNDIVYEGELTSLRQIKKEVTELSEGQECGVLLDNFHDWVKKDSITVFDLKIKQPSLS